MLKQIGHFAEGNLTVHLDADRDDEIARLCDGRLAPMPCAPATIYNPEISE